MAELTDVPEDRRHLLAVYETSEKVAEAERRVRELGVTGDQITVGSPSDAVISLRAEGREELAEGWILPAASFAMPKEGAKGFLVVAGGFSLAGALIAFPFAFIDFGFGFLGRVIMLVAIGLGFGGAIGLVAGPALSSKKSTEPSAADRGTVLRVAADSADVRNALMDVGPIRLDEISPAGSPLKTVGTEEQENSDGVVQDLQGGLRGNDDMNG